MSLGIYTATPEGIVLAADSRQSYRNRKGASRIGSDSASKILKLNERCGLIVTGLAFLESDGAIKGIGRFVEEFCDQTEMDSTGIEGLSGELHRFFEPHYDKIIYRVANQLKSNLKRRGCKDITIRKEKGRGWIIFKDPTGVEKKQPIESELLNFAVAGYSSDASHHVYEVSFPGAINVKISSEQKSKEYGTGWVGQGDAVARILKGYDDKIGQLPMIQKAIQDTGEDAVRTQLSMLAYHIRWGTMTLQDAIDFSRLMIETTSAMQRFADGVLGNPGDIPGVGGPIDVAVITRDKGFVWVSKKKLHSGGREVDLESIEDLEKRLAKSSRPQNKKSEHK